MVSIRDFWTYSVLLTTHCLFCLHNSKDFLYIPIPLNWQDRYVNNLFISFVRWSNYFNGIKWTQGFCVFSTWKWTYCGLWDFIRLSATSIISAAENQLVIVSLLHQHREHCVMLWISLTGIKTFDLLEHLRYHNGVLPDYQIIISLQRGLQNYMSG